MKLIFWSASAVLLEALILGMPASASPFTYQFAMPDWTFSTSSALFGSNALLSVTVDNGALSSANQNYSLANVNSITVTALGGTFTDTMSSLLSAQNINTSFLLTDGSGNATLNLSNLPFPNAAAAITLENPATSDTTQLSRVSIGGGNSFLVGSASGDSAFVNGPTNCFNANTGLNNGYCGFRLTNDPSTAVPEPFTISLFGAGLAGAIAARRRTKMKAA